MKVLNLLQSGTVGGIEKLCKDIAGIADYNNAFVFLFYEGLIYDEMKAMGADVHSLAQYGEKKINKDRLDALKKLAEPYDIIMVHHSALAVQMCYVYLKKEYPNKKFVFVAHSCFDKRYNYDIYTNPIKRLSRKYYLKKALDVSDKIIFVSEAGKRSYDAHFRIPQDKMIVVYNGIVFPDPASYVLVPREDGAPYRMTYIGRLTEVKGVQNFLRTIPMLREKGFLCEVWICGDGDYRNTLESLAKELQIEELVSFEGVQRDIQRYLCKTDVFLYPSICEEVFGISIVEALSYGVPCVAYRVGGIPEILSDNQNGMIADELTVESLCEAIERLLVVYQSKQIEEIKRCCLKTAERFTIQNTVKQLKQCCKNLLVK